MELRGFHQMQTAVAEQRAVLDVEPVTARRLVVQGRPPIAEYIGAGTRSLFRGLGVLYVSGLGAGIVLLVTGRFVYAALAFLAAIVLQQVWGNLAIDLLRMMAMRDAAFCQLALREGWIQLIEPPHGPGRPAHPIAMDPAAEPTYAEELTRAKDLVARRPDDAQARFQLGITYLLAGDFNEALDQSRQLTMLDARLAAKLQALARLLAS